MFGSRRATMREPAEAGTRKLVVGLGNPGRRYEGSRHNVGFQVIAGLAARWNAGPPRQRFEGELFDVRPQDQRLLLLAPQTYMNLSGGSVLAARDFYKIQLQDLLIVCDDFQLPLGKLRVRPRGSAGGQNGLADILRRLGDEGVPGLRIGIGPVGAGWEAADFVLGKFDKREREVIEVALVRAMDAVDLWARQGVDACMNTYNRDE